MEYYMYDAAIKKYLCLENNCNKLYSTKKIIITHLWDVHDINVNGNKSIHKCDIDDCKFQSKRKGALTQHLFEIHNIGQKKIYKCPEKNCIYEAKRKGEINRHLWEIHDINNGTFKHHVCNEKKCKFKTKIKSTLNTHLWQVHKININNKYKIHKCSQPKCILEFKSSSALNRHLWTVHNIDVSGKRTFFKCTEKKCESIFKQKKSLEIHLWYKHSVNSSNKFKMLKCTEKNCESVFKMQNNLNEHLWTVHNINTSGKRKIFSCLDKDCVYETKSNRNFKNHLSNVHDIGDKICETCLANVFSIIKFHDKNMKKDLEICRKCYAKATGYNSKIEKTMVEYVKKIKDLKNYILLEDKIVKGIQCKTKRRPDLLLSSTEDLYIMLECDEQQHSGYIPECENGRIDEILDEIPNGRKIIIRWNPHKYQYNETKNKNQTERLKLLEKLLLYVIEKDDWEDDENIVIYYMFYDEDNAVITDRWKYQIIYNEEDIL